MGQGQSKYANRAAQGKERKTKMSAQEKQEDLNQKLYRACSASDTQQVITLVSEGADPNYKDNFWKFTVLGEAAYCGNLEIVKVLVDHGANIKTKDWGGRTAFLVACAGGQPAVADFLMNKGSNIQDSDNNGSNAVHLASWNGHMGTIEFLMEHNVDIHHTDQNGRNAIHLASERGNLDAIKYLIEKGVDVKHTDIEDNTALHRASYGRRLDTILWLMKLGLCINFPNKDGKTPLDYLKEKTLVDVGNDKREQCLRALEINPGYSECPLEVPPATQMKLSKVMNEASGNMRVACVLLHGPPLVGKTSVKRLILNQPPLAKEDENSTNIMEDPVRAIHTTKFIGTEKGNVEVVDEEKMIRMIQREVETLISRGPSFLAEKTPTPEQALILEPRTPEPKYVPKECSTTASPFKMQNNTDASDVDKEIPEVLREIATGLIDLAKLTNAPNSALFNLQWFYLIDSGGQPQFSDLLPVLFRSSCHHHIVVIRLDEKLDDRPQNKFKKNGKEYRFPEHLALTYFQTIERVCMIAKASNSWVVVVGTHLDKENQDEPLAKKNERLNELVLKYQTSLVTHDEEVIFAVDAMTPVGFQREEYAQSIQQELLHAPALGNDRGYEDGVRVPLWWLVLGLELSRRSKGWAVPISECAYVAGLLGIDDPHELNEALNHFTEIAVHYHYPEAIPDKIFTSITPIATSLSAIVESLFVIPTHGPQHKDHKRLCEKGELTRTYFKKLLPGFLDEDNDILKLFRHLRIIFDINNDTFFIPSLLPVGAPQKVKNSPYMEPLLLFCSAEDGDMSFLPQPYFHSLIVELLRREEVSLCTTKQYRSSIILNVKFDQQSLCTVCIENHNFWLELFVNKHLFVPAEHRSSLLKIIHDCSQTVLEQLNLSTLHQLEYGLHCPRTECGIQSPHPCKLASCYPCFTFCCLKDQQVTLLEKNEERLSWFKEIELQALPCIRKQIMPDECSSNQETEPEKVTEFKKRIEKCVHQPEYKRAQGIILIVGMFGAAGTVVDIENVQQTFKELNFAILLIQDPTASEIASLIEGAAKFQYPYRYKFVAFYYAGHGGIDKLGRPFVVPLQITNSNSDILHIEQFIIEPLKQKDLTRLFFFDCCQSQRSDTVAFRSTDMSYFVTKKPKPHPGQVVAYAASKGQMSVGDTNKGGLWTHHLCKHLSKEHPIVTVLAETYKDVVKERDDFQEPTVVSQVSDTLTIRRDYGTPVEVRSKMFRAEKIEQ